MTFSISVSFSSPTCNSSNHTGRSVQTSQLRAFPPFVLVIQGLCTSLMALINSLVMVLTSALSLHSSGACRILVYLDPGLSLLAVIILIAIAMPQVRICEFMSTESRTKVSAQEALNIIYRC